MYDANDMLTFIQRAILTRSFSDQEGEMAELLKAEMLRVGFDEAFIDSTGNVVGRIGNGGKIIHFDSHLDTVQVNDLTSGNSRRFPAKLSGAMSGVAVAWT